jgi:hypothetical protein
LNDTHLLSASFDGTIYLWSVDSTNKLSWKGKNNNFKFGLTNMILSRNSQFIITSDPLSKALFVANLTIWKINYNQNTIDIVN